jgi:hypothetical protein
VEREVDEHLLKIEAVRRALDDLERRGLLDVTGGVA